MWPISRFSWIGRDVVSAGPAIATHALSTPTGSATVRTMIVCTIGAGFGTKKTPKLIAAETRFVTLICFFGCFRAACGMLSSATNQPLLLLSLPSRWGTARSDGRCSSLISNHTRCERASYCVRFHCPLGESLGNKLIRPSL